MVVSLFKCLKMQAVGRIGGYISRSVYTVSGTFHPFGGAVDTIVVKQPDGSYKSSPWYVRFGKFQGVLKSKEKLVSINVNGVEANFHMYLDSKGEAYFLKEVDKVEEESASSPPSSSGDDMDRQSANRPPLNSKNCNDTNCSESVLNGGDGIKRTNSRRAQFLGLVFGGKSNKEGGISLEERESGVFRTESLEHAEMAADLLDLRWSTNLASPRRKKENALRFSDQAMSKDIALNSQVNGCINNGTSLVSHSSCEEVVSTAERNGKVVDTTSSECVVETATSMANVGEANNSSNSESAECANCSFHSGGCKEVCVHPETVHGMAQSITEVRYEPEREMIIGQETLDVQECVGNRDHITFVHEERIAVIMDSTSESPVSESYSQAVHLHPSDDLLQEQSQTVVAISSLTDSTCTLVEEQMVPRQDQISKQGSPVGLNVDLQILNHDCVTLGVPSSGVLDQETLLFGKSDEMDSSETKHVKCIHVDNKENEADSAFSVRVTDGNSDSSHAKCCFNPSPEQPVINNYPNIANPQLKKLRTISSADKLNKMDDVQSRELQRTARSLPIMSPISNNSGEHDFGHALDEINDQQRRQSMDGDVKITRESKGNPPRPHEGISFQRSRSMKSSDDMEGANDATKVNSKKKKIRTLTPTSEQLASLNLKEGKNVVVYTFSTAMLGKQQVEAHIFLWRWDARIVISDVDGTITRSDLLGQVMPLVGMDWSQTGVAHLFSAIKENGYQLLFLSARSISQAFITRQFLFNIKQDGKALPEGPVVISPDGLFPSLFREVVRRAPHEFKIACLEDIKALFPAGSSPFYAGFGNRETDEFSYLKVGIPRSKIFIINPKGEIVVNRCINTKSYLSLHALVNRMFPITSFEQEDYNSWNYWKLPPPDIDV